MRPLGQFDGDPGVIDLAWGHPGPDLLPVDLIRDAASRALGRYGPDALGYGATTGPGPFLEWLSAHLGTIDSRAPAPAELLVTAGASQGLDLVCGRLTRPADVCLVPTPTYHLALRILGDHPLELVEVPCGEEGLSGEALADAIARVRSRGGNPRLLYLIPTYADPTGVTLPVERRQEIARVCAAAGVIIVEDDVYRELAFDGAPPPSLWSLAEPGVVIRLGSFSKTLAPGLRVGYLAADRATIERLAGGGLLDSGGGINHVGALVAAELGASGAYAAHVVHLRQALAARRDALAGALREHLPGSAFSIPGGGYFLWWRLPANLGASRLQPHALRHRVGGMPGGTFSIHPGAHADVMRLSFSLYSASQLAVAGERLGAAVGDALDDRTSSAR